MAKYRVLREHIGDKPYERGDTREAEPADVAHLLGRVLAPLAEEKAAPPVRNKVAPRVRNKAAAKAKNKGAN